MRLLSVLSLCSLISMHALYILIRVPFEFELESSSVSVKSWIEYDNSAVNNFQLIKDKYNKNHKKSFSDLKLAQFTTVGQLSFSSYV